MITRNAIARPLASYRPSTPLGILRPDTSAISIFPRSRGINGVVPLVECKRPRDRTHLAMEIEKITGALSVARHAKLLDKGIRIDAERVLFFFCFLFCFL